jgi:hypothetical protein
VAKDGRPDGDAHHQVTADAVETLHQLIVVHRIVGGTPGLTTPVERRPKTTRYNLHHARAPGGMSAH